MLWLDIWVSNFKDQNPTITVYHFELTYAAIASKYVLKSFYWTIAFFFIFVLV